MLQSDGDVKRCSRAHNCFEKGRVTCTGNGMHFLHIRFDPCMMPNRDPHAPKRCDCVIFAFDRTKKKQAAFVIEVKKSYEKATLEIIQAKLQTCINRIQEILMGHMNSIEIFPILCDNKHSTLVAQAALTKFYRVKCYSIGKSIIVNKYQKNIVDYYLLAAKKWT